MRSEIHFTHMDRSPAVEQYATERVDAIIEEYLGSRSSVHWQAWMVTDKPTDARGPHVFRCELSVRYAPKREIFVRKEAPDMYDAINMATQSLTSTISEETKKERQRKRRTARAALTVNV
jgi:ribosome-associated translation inhibitor RaiA